ncbi:MAG: hypothetical protein ACYSSI_10025 [Planctomycetota bacterium]|jgi:hypothetical protein
MKKRNKVIIKITTLGILLFFNFRFQFITIDKLISFKNCVFKFCSPEIVRRGDLDELWDHEKVLIPDKSGYYYYAIGLRDNKVIAVRRATDNTVFLKELDIDFKTSKDYSVNNGDFYFREFIEEDIERMKPAD